MSAAGQARTSPPWWAALPSADAQVSCGEQTHRLHWEEGRLTARDHQDAEGELVLAALGGERSECMDLVESWGTRGDDLEVLAVGPRSAADEPTISPELVAQLQASGGGVTLLGGRGVAYSSSLHVGWSGSRAVARPGMPWAGLVQGAARLNAVVAASAPRAIARRAAVKRAVARRAAALGNLPSPASFSRPVASLVVGSGGRLRSARRQAHDQAGRASDRRAELFSLLALGPEFQMRLSATVAAAWADGGRRAGGRAAVRPALAAALTGRLAPAARSWLGIDPGQVEVALHEDAGWGQLELSGTGGGRRLRAALPAGWLASVWAAGLAVTAGHLIVSITEVAWPEATVLGVPEPGAEPVTLRVRADGGAWTAAAAGNGA